MSKKEYLPIKEAAQWLGVTISTIHAWIRRGHIREVERPVTISVRCVPVCDLKKAFLVNCKLCGKTFKAKHPLKAAFCSVDHRNAWFREKALADMPRGRVRPRRRRKARATKSYRAAAK
ncbi:MAG: helix-turn-helix domain-containing protein [Acidobacteria bacterium]|nr:helix-turn-helix domain-containing protein [Acidobacteriota bacterium]